MTEDDQMREAFENDPDWERHPEKPGRWRLTPEARQRRLQEAMEKQANDPAAIRARHATELAAEAVRLRDRDLENDWRHLLGLPGTSREQQTRELIGPGTEDWPHGIESWTFDGVGIADWYSEAHARALAERVVNAIQEKPLLHALVELTDHSVDDVAEAFFDRFDTKDRRGGHLLLRDALIALKCDPTIATNTTKKQRV